MNNLAVTLPLVVGGFFTMGAIKGYDDARSPEAVDACIVARSSARVDGDNGLRIVFTANDGAAFWTYALADGTSRYVSNPARQSDEFCDTPQLSWPSREDVPIFVGTLTLRDVINLAQDKKVQDWKNAVVSLAGAVVGYSLGHWTGEKFGRPTLHDRIVKERLADRTFRERLTRDVLWNETSACADDRSVPPAAKACLERLLPVVADRLFGSDPAPILEEDYKRLVECGCSSSRQARGGPDAGLKM